MSALTDAYAVLKTGTLWSSTGKCKGYAVANPGEAAKIDAYVAALNTDTATAVPPALATATGRGIVGMLAALAPKPAPAPSPTPQPSLFPSYRLTLPPNQYAGSKTGTNAYVNLGGRGSNVVQPSAAPSWAGRIIDTFDEPEWWYILQFRAPDEWPWSVGGVPGWFNFWNPHLSSVDPMWANQSWFNVSPLTLQLNAGYAKPPAGMISPLFMFEQWDGLTHYPVAGKIPKVADVTVGDIHDLVIRCRFGFYSMQSWANVKNPPPADKQTTGLVQVWVDGADQPVFDSDVFAASVGQVIDGVSHISTTRVCRNPADGSYWAQRYAEHYEQAYTTTWASPASPLHWDMRMLAMGTTLEAAAAEIYQATVLTDNSIWNGQGSNLGNASYAKTPDVWPAPRLPKGQ